MPIQKRVDPGWSQREDLTQLEDMHRHQPGFPEARVLAARIARASSRSSEEPADLEKASELIDEAMGLFPEESAPLREAARIALTGNRIAERGDVSRETRRA